MRLDATDLKILAVVQRDGRITKLRLAEEVGLSPTPCWLRLRKLEEAGLITGYAATLAPRKIAPFTSVILSVTLESHRQADFDRFESAVLALPEVVALWSVGGGVDYFVKLVSADIEAYQALVDRLLNANIGIDRYFTYVVTKTLRENGPFPLGLLTKP